MRAIRLANGTRRQLTVPTAPWTSAPSKAPEPPGRCRSNWSTTDRLQRRRAHSYKPLTLGRDLALCCA